MEQTANELYDYLLIVSPDWRANLRISKVLQHFTKSYGFQFRDQMKPHIELVNFVQHLSAEKFLIKHFERFTKTVMPEVIETDGFGSLPCRSVYATLKNPDPIREIVTNLRTKYEKKLKSPGAAKPAFAGTPHIMIAEKMAEEQFEKAWNDWQDTRLDISFKVKEMLLLRRKQGVNVKAYQLIKSFQFGATSCIKPAQLMLF